MSVGLCIFGVSYFSFQKYFKYKFTIQFYDFLKKILGLYIDTVSCTLFIVCIGLSVDFSVHVVHSYIHSHGTTREMKMINGLKVSIMFYL